MDDLVAVFSHPWVIGLCLCALFAAVCDFPRLGWWWHLVAVPGAIAAGCLTWCPLFFYVPVLWFFGMLARFLPGRRY